MSPGYPDTNYPNNAFCLWEINVPTGFHIELNFDHIDIANSALCTKDSLIVTQELQSRGKNPLREYFFFFDHQEELKVIHK